MERRRTTRHGVVVAVRRSTSTCAQWTATRGEVEMLQGGTGAERAGAQQGHGAWPTAAANAVMARTEKGDGGDGIAVIRSKFKIRFANSIFLLLYGLK